jgi:hypothetical protein
MFFPIMIESRNKYKINYINLCVYLPNAGLMIFSPLDIGFKIPLLNELSTLRLV